MPFLLPAAMLATPIAATTIATGWMTRKSDRNARDLSAEMEVAAEHLGLDVSRSGGAVVRIHGEINGITVHGSRRNSGYWNTVLDLAVDIPVDDDPQFFVMRERRPLNLSNIRLDPEDFLLDGTPDYQTADPLFDRTMYVRCQDERRMSEYLTPERRWLIIGLFKDGACSVISYQSIRSRQSRQDNGWHTIDHVERLVNAATELS